MSGSASKWIKIEPLHFRPQMAATMMLSPPQFGATGLLRLGLRPEIEFIGSSPEPFHAQRKRPKTFSRL
jgi:hypothetical protein